jgi:hypothetical protein
MADLLYRAWMRRLQHFLGCPAPRRPHPTPSAARTHGG